MQMAGVHLERVSKRFGAVEAVRDLSLDIPTGTFFSLLGPSGCGKTTLLRIVAGFERPDSGRVYIAGREVTALPPQQRPTAMVFQSYALFPHMTVEENVAYGLRLRGYTVEERRKRVRDMLRRVGLEGMERRPVTQLSGGQQQRVALARALVVSPEVVLFDEPLSNLDVALREQTRRELKLLQHRLGMTAIYVTHDQQEALALSDRMGVMRAGRLLQVGTPEELYYEPRTAFVAQFLGGSNLITDARLLEQLFPGQRYPEGKVLAIRPEHWQRVPEDTPGSLRLRVLSTQFLGSYREWWVEAEGQRLRVWMPMQEMPSEEVTLKPLEVCWVEADEEPLPEEVSTDQTGVRV